MPTLIYSITCDGMTALVVLGVWVSEQSSIRMHHSFHLNVIPSLPFISLRENDCISRVVISLVVTCHFHLLHSTHFTDIITPHHITLYHVTATGPPSSSLSLDTDACSSSCMPLIILLATDEMLPTSSATSNILPATSLALSARLLAPSTILDAPCWIKRKKIGSKR